MRFKMLPALAVLAWLALGGGAHAGTCEQRSPKVFAIQGATDRAMADCVAARLQKGVTELVVDSEGGPADAAMDIAERLAGLRDLTIRVDGQCASSCANYILPLGRRLIVGRTAILYIHGGIDGAYVARAAPDRRAAAQALADRQTAFARAHRIPPGWLLYHTAQAPTRVEGLDGAFGWRPEGAVRYYLIEPPLLRSCLPWLNVDAYAAWLASQMTPERIARLKKNHVGATGAVVCNGRGW